ncbi:hypothetical protein MSSIT_0928 [Methanosarcina siciliae T4/M]|uniref:Uncharacterized protein n=2 Tax=Methanosarcina siciliae TaxID=38027 RepID=A0A0E3PBJ4_9EURY|nr:hypothetical protein [Methanosarcina siciliae]AKB27647.1 hypothetical protein MSSIT_0928 [Methanosarcina siciliae T4/M]AKB31587.1 hypothetical protein MSSIH_0897 [Methanosarcina siciliae HI350]
MILKSFGILIAIRKLAVCFDRVAALQCAVCFGRVAALQCAVCFALLKQTICGLRSELCSSGLLDA